MRIVIALMALLAVQVSGQESPKEIVKKAVIKNAFDSQIIQKQYQFDAIKDQKTSDGEGISDRLSIEELFGHERYRYEMDDQVPLSLNGRPVYLINFFPKDEDSPNAPKGTGKRGRIKNEILNHLRGTVYVDKDDFGIARVVTHANNPPEKISVVGRLYSMEATLEQDRLGEVWVPKYISVETEFSYWLGWHHSRENTRIEFQNFRLKAP